MLDGSQKYGGRWDDERALNSVVDQMVLGYIGRYFDVVLDETHVDYHKVAAWEAHGEIEGFQVEVIFLDTPEEECIARDNNRPFPVGRDVIHKYAEQFRKEGLNV